MKWFEIHWYNGDITYVKGNTDANAVNDAGIGMGAVPAIDFIKEATELPLNMKETVLISLDKQRQILNERTMFVEIAKQHVAEGSKDFEIKIARHSWYCTAEITPFQLILTEYLKEE